MTTGPLVVEFRQTTRASSSGAGYLRLYRFPGGGKDAVRKQACGTLVATFAPECVRGNIERLVSCVMMTLHTRACQLYISKCRGADDGGKHVCHRPSHNSSAHCAS